MVVSVKVPRELNALESASPTPTDVQLARCHMVLATHRRRTPSSAVSWHRATAKNHFYGEFSLELREDLS